MEVRQVDMTPQMAGRLLETNTRNRHVNRARVAMWAQTMRDGLWQANGQPIILSTDGRLLDGQHRLLACLEANVTVPMLIVTGVASEAQYTMDTGRPRSLADMLALRGEQNVNILASALKALVRLDRYGIRAGFDMQTAHYPVTYEQAFAYLKQHPTLRADIVECERIYRHTGIPLKIIILWYELFYRADADAASMFFTQLASGVGLDADNPILVLRERARRLRDTNQLHTTLGVITVSAIGIKAWNMFRAGASCQTLAFRAAGRVESFPQVSGLEESQHA